MIFGLSIGQAADALAIPIIGYEARLFDAAILNAVVLMMLVTAVASPWITKRAGERLALATEVEPDLDATEASRILFPITQAGDRQRRLLEFVFLLHARRDGAPVHLLSVVDPDDAGPTGDDVERVQRSVDDLAGLGGLADARAALGAPTAADPAPTAVVRPRQPPEGRPGVRQAVPAVPLIGDAVTSDLVPCEFSSGPRRSDPDTIPN